MPPLHKTKSFIAAGARPRPTISHYITNRQRKQYLCRNLFVGATIGRPFFADGCGRSMIAPTVNILMRSLVICRSLFYWCRNIFSPTKASHFKRTSALQEMNPPSAVRVCPVINEAFSLARKKIASAISRGSAILPSGVRSESAAIASSS